MNCVRCFAKIAVQQAVVGLPQARYLHRNLRFAQAARGTYGHVHHVHVNDLPRPSCHGLRLLRIRFQFLRARIGASQKVSLLDGKGDVPATLARRRRPCRRCWLFSLW